MVKQSFRNLLLNILMAMCVMVSMNYGFELIKPNAAGEYGPDSGLGVTLIVVVPLMLIGFYLYRSTRRK